jgi:hypothetical protein
MDAIKDVIFMQDNINYWWTQLRLYGATRKPWKPGQTIADTNPQVLQANHRSENISRAEGKRENQCSLYMPNEEGKFEAQCTNLNSCKHSISGRSFLVI